ncbi:MAG: hypothetical protein GX442_12640 [Candidatus Riflebacteria bacterium]|nr:hypothetical protein [Candidatus Riflebacteria bacterium]
MPAFLLPKNLLGVYETRVLDPLSRAGVRALLSRDLATEGFGFLRDELPTLVRAVIPDGRERRGTLEIVKGTGEAVGSSLVLMTGLLAGGPVWLPVAGALLGLHGAWRVCEGFGAHWQDRQVLDFLRVYLPCLRFFQKSDDYVSPEEEAHLESLLASYRLTPDEIAEVTRVRIHKITEVIVPDWFTADQRKLLIAGCWGIAYCDGVMPQELADFKGLIRSIGFTEAEIREVMAETQLAIDTRENLLLAMGALAWQILSPAEYQQGLFLRTMAGFLVRKTGHKSLTDRLTSTHFPQGRLDTAGLVGHPRLRDLLACAWFLCLCRQPLAAEIFGEFEAAFQTLCEDLRQKAWGTTVRAEMAVFLELVLSGLLRKVQDDGI